MTGELQLTLLGKAEVRRDGARVTGFNTNKDRALLFYLSVTGRPHVRAALAGLLWGDVAESAARASLRKALSSLRRVVGTHLSIAGQEVAFNRHSPYWLDVELFVAQTASEADIEQLQGAIELYRGGFLEGFYVRRAPAFEEWVLAQRARLHGLALQALHRLAAYHTDRGTAGLAAGIETIARLLELEPWREEAHRQLMRLLARSGQRGAALAQYETCRRVLAEELGVEAGTETTALYEQIRDEELSGLGPEPSTRVFDRALTLRSQPAGIREEQKDMRAPVSSRVASPPFLFPERQYPIPRSPFVGRERELTQMGRFLHRALARQGQVVFVVGEAGSGKTALVQEFARRAQARHAGLVVARGNCTAYAGAGEPYLPFREILGLFTGGVEAQWAAGAISRDHALRLWRLSAFTIQALVDHGPDLIDTFVPVRILTSHAAAHTPNAAGWLERLQELISRRAAATAGQVADQRRIFEQFTGILEVLAARQPLLLILDDLHWADVSSISLLFHLGRRIGDNRILIVGTYRPEDVAVGRGAERHPLEDMTNEFKRYYGDIWVDLSQQKAEGRQFVDAILDIDPNRLGEGFRQALFRQTQGHALFTVELLRDAQDRGTLQKDPAGRWVEGPTLDWRTLPAKVEGVIEKRIGRLERDLREILSVASVEGGDFTAQAIASVQGIRERPLLRQLSQQLEKRHRLVRVRGEIKVGRQRLSRYRFAHALFQQYVYNELSVGERRLLHGEIAQALEALYGDEAEEFAVQLAHHFLRGEAWDKAFHYLHTSGDRARQAFANQEAIAFYSQALEISHQITPPIGGADLLPVYEGRGLVRMLLTDYDEAIADFRAMLQLSRTSGNQQKEGESLCHLAFAHWGKLSEDQLPSIEKYAWEAHELSQRTGDQKILARSLTSLGLVQQVRGNLHESDSKLETSLRICRREGYQDALASNLLWLNAHAYWLGDYARALEIGQEGLIVARAIRDGLVELLGLAFLCQAYWGAGECAKAFAVLHEGLAKAKERNSTFIVGRLMNTLGWFHRELDDVSHATEYDHESVELGRAAGISHVEISALINLGLDCLALGQYGRALSYLEPTLDRVEREVLGTERWRWMVHLPIALAEVHYAQGEYERALRYVEQGLERAQATSLQRYVANGQLLHGRVLIALVQFQA
jgi:DNA-binding SARP family transcriptional activator/tetratricopeptide (TPR) repeat protein